jgi:hypothetical protein
METSSQGIIIADTSGLISLFSPNDQNHEVAVEAARRIRKLLGALLCVRISVR